MRVSVPFVLSFVNEAFAISRCGAQVPSDELRAAHAAYAQIEAAEYTSNASVYKREGFTISVYAHVISGEDDNGLDQSDVEAQIDTLNKRYLNTGFNFELTDTSFSSNDSWLNITIGSQFEYDMKSTLRGGFYKDLNLYFTTFAEIPDFGQPLGYAPFPQRSVDAIVFALDGAIVDPGTVPGGTLEPYNLGITAVHEVGHWMGLFHTFEAIQGSDGCQGQGDHVADTPAEESAASGCEVGRDSCPLLPGKDPIHNYMDYSDDSCLDSFSNGQIKRMHNFFKNDRANFAGFSGNGTVETDPDTAGSNPHRL